MKSVLIHVQPFSTRLTTTIDVRAGDSLEADAYGLGGEEWRPAIVRRPNFSLELFTPQLDAQIQVGRANFTMSLHGLGLVDRNDLRWLGAAVKIYVLAGLEFDASNPFFDGIISSAQIDTRTDRLTVTAAVSRDKIDVPLLTEQWLGTGGDEGDSEMRGVFKPLGYGVNENVPVKFFDTTYWIGCVEGHGNLTSVDKLMEGLNSKGTSVGDYASYTALKTAIDNGTIAPGFWGTCIAEGLIGLGAPPVKPITANITCANATFKTMLLALLEDQAGVDTADIDTTMFTALDTSVPFATYFWTETQQDVSAVLAGIAQSFNGSVFMDFDGKVRVTRAVRGTADETLDLEGKQEPRVINHQAGAPISPVYRIRANAERPASVLTIDEVIVDYPVTPAGLYNSSTTYQPGSVVYRADGAEFLALFDVPTAGAALPTGDYPATNSAWTQTKPALEASAIGRAGGSIVLGDTFDPAYWTYAVNASRVDLAASASGKAIEQSFQASTDAFTSFEGELGAYIQLFPGVDVWAGITADSDVAATTADWDLELEVEWYNSALTLLSTTTVSTLAAATTTEQTVLELLTPPATARFARLQAGHSSQTGKTGAWTFYNPWLAHYQPGADNTPENTPYLVGPFDTFVYFDVEDTIITGQLTRTIVLARYEGAVDVSPQTTWAITVHGDATATINNTADSADRGKISLSAFTGSEAYLYVTSTYKGVTIERTIRVSGVYQTPTELSGNVAEGRYEVNGFFTGGTYADVIDFYILVPISTPENAIAMGYAFDVAGVANADVNVSFQIAYKLESGGSWATATATSKDSEYDTATQHQSKGRTQQDVIATGVSNGNNYIVRVQGKINSGTGPVVFNGTFYARADIVI